MPVGTMAGTINEPTSAIAYKMTVLQIFACLLCSQKAGMRHAVTVYCCGFMDDISDGCTCSPQLAFASTPSEVRSTDAGRNFRHYNASPETSQARMLLRGLKLESLLGMRPFDTL